MLPPPDQGLQNRKHFGWVLPHFMNFSLKTQSGHKGHFCILFEVTEFLGLCSGQPLSKRNPWAQDIPLLKIASFAIFSQI